MKPGFIAAAVLVSMAMLLGSAHGGTAEETPQLPDVADKASASIVSIQAEKIDTAPDALHDPETEFGKSNTREGTGLVLTVDGLIVTATSVVEKVGKITLTFADGRQATAQVVGRDPKTGVALLKETTATGLHPVQFADAELLRRGAPVFSIGNVYGLHQSLSSGIISAIRPSNMSHLILQTDLLVRPGSLGAPLFNSKGELVGMFTSRYVVSGKATGVGLAVSSNLIQSVAGKLQKSGTADHGWLGLSTRKPTDEEAKALGMGATRGVIVVKVPGEGPTKAGLVPGDAIEAFNGEPVGDPFALGWRITRSEPNTEVAIGILRKSGRSTVHVKLSKAPEPLATSSTPPPAPASGKTATCLRYIPSVGITVPVACEE